MMKKVIYLLGFSLLMASACESTDDILNGLDHEVPEVVFLADSSEVNAGDTFTVHATISDASGIERIEFSYGVWRINEIVDLTDEFDTETYEFQVEITVPEDAVLEWEEDLDFNDGTSIKIVQKYHSLEMKAWDKNRNLREAVLHLSVL